MARRAYGIPEIHRHMDEEQFVADGYLLEANRQFFHPLGLELVAQVGDKRLQLRVQDCRELSAGLLFRCCDDEELREDRMRKVARVGCAWETRAQRRLARYGWVVQPPEFI